MTSSQKNASSSTPYPDNIASSRSAQNPVTTNQQLLDTVSSGDFGNLVDDNVVVVAAITANDEEGALDTFGDGEEDGGDKVFRVVGLLEDFDLFAESGAVWMSVLFIFVDLYVYFGVVYILCFTQPNWPIWWGRG